MSISTPDVPGLVQDPVLPQFGGAEAELHGCAIEDPVLIGMGATVLYGRA
jgi:hypothetical protein